MRSTTAAFIFFVSLLALAGGSGAQEGVAVATTLHEQLAQLNATMKEIAKLLERQVDGQETSLLIKRVELTGRTLIAKKERLRKARTEATNLEEEEAGLTRTLELVEQQLAETAESEAEHQMQWGALEQRLETVKRRRRDLARELMVLENEVATAQEDMDVLDAVLDVRLGLR